MEQENLEVTNWPLSGKTISAIDDIVNEIPL